MGKIKYIFLLLISVLISSFSGGDKAALSTDAMNVLYIGLDNPITVRHAKIKCKNLIVIMEPESLATIEQTGCGKYNIKLKERSREGAKLLVYKNKVKEKNLLASLSYRTMNVPKLDVNIGGITKSFISKKELSAAKELNVEMLGFAYSGFKYELVSYDYLYKPKNGEIIRGSAQGAAFPTPLLTAFKNAEIGDQIIVSNIYATSRLGTVQAKDIRIQVFNPNL